VVAQLSTSGEKIRRMSKIISKSKELQFSVRERDIRGIDNEEFFGRSLQIRTILHLDFVSGLASEDKLTQSKPYNRLAILTLLQGSIRSLKNQSHLLDREYKVKINGGQWETGHISGRVNEQHGYSVSCRGSGVCTLKITSLGTEGLGFNHSIHDLRPHENFDFQNLHIQIKSKPAGNKILSTLVLIRDFLQRESDDELVFDPK
jgi:hypothetical protein